VPVRFEIVQNRVHLFQESDVGVPKRDRHVVIQIRVEDERIQNAKPAFGMRFLGTNRIPNQTQCRSAAQIIECPADIPLIVRRVFERVVAKCIAAALFGLAEKRSQLMRA
jgi:hypothetical protein